MTMEIKKRIIYVLVAFTVFLILLNAILALFDKNYVEEPIAENFLSKVKIEKAFEEILSTYGIKNSWIKKHPFKKNQYDSLKYRYEINIPTSVPIPMVLKELSIKLRNKNVKITSTEEKINGLTELKIKSGSSIKLAAKLKYDNTLLRPFSSTSFILNNIDDLGNDKLNELLSTPLKFGALLPLRSSSIIIAEKVLTNKKNYFISLDDDADKPNFELDEDLNISQLKKNIKSIISSFNTPHKYFINKKKTGFSNSFINFLIDEFNKKGRKILDIKSFINLKGENKADLNSLLEFHLNKLKPGDSQLFLINTEDWNNIQPVLNLYLKKGNKIVLPKYLL